MRLSKIKMAGFKSFVDPTIIQLPSELVGVVGPNGCGKSNIIDAVRWVMGERSKHLRGDSMEDVIFNGSNTRKPVGQASIELIFDNSDGAIGGQYAQYGEISIRRQVSRDGQSKYLINGTKCRQRDVKDIFLGTGLGPHSYAIIEQGMISQLIEAKPEDLRIFLEEAAGISKYKERRRETENRMRHTRENLDRLNDLREEIEKQLNRLKRQANTAERYKKLKEEERRVKAELLCLNWQIQDTETREREQELKVKETRLDQLTAELRAAEVSLEKLRAEHTEANEAFNKVQGHYYRLGGDISRTEQSIQFSKDARERQQHECQGIQTELEESVGQMDNDRERMLGMQKDIDELEASLLNTRSAQEQSTGELNDLEGAMTTWQHQWEDLTHRLVESNQVAQVERTRMEHLEQQTVQYNHRETRIRDELSTLTEDKLTVEIEQLESRVVALRADADAQQNQLGIVLKSIQEQRDQNRSLNHQLDEARGRVQDFRGRLASLQALQEAALGKRQKSVLEWLNNQDLADAPRLAERIRVDPGWERALENVLGLSLEAVCVADVDEMIQKLDSLEHGHVTLLDTSKRMQLEDVPANQPETLLSRVRAPWSLESFLQGVYLAEDLTHALSLRESLQSYESVITRDGIWLGKNWLRVVRDPDEHAGVLAREMEIKTLNEKLNNDLKVVEGLEQALARGREDLKHIEQSREEAQIESNRAHRTLTEIEARLNQRSSQLKQTQSRRKRLGEELNELLVHKGTNKESLEQSSRRRNQALDVVNELQGERETLEHERHALRAALDDARGIVKTQTDAAHQIALRLESLRAANQSAQQGVERMEQQRVHLQRRLDELTALLAQALEPLQRQEQELEVLLGERVTVEQALTESRTHVQTIESQIRDQEQQRISAERDIEALRLELDELRMAWQENHVRSQMLKEQLDASGFVVENLLSEMEQGATVARWEEMVEETGKRIDRLGPINLAAIDEFKEQSQRKEYLDQQHSDLTEALETLEDAIRKIDRETRQRFRDTFERVNQRLQDTFPRLFGGGQAQLEMTGDDLLTTGISILARPPGKRLSTIHLMSGGEKALTAVALVFAIFELNPAPFCMLDEVDAPLDEANVGRFCDLVREMSETVQFIVITHNKATMEFAEQLVGITMHEPGVSRLVTVDVDEAAQMAAG